MLATVWGWQVRIDQAPGQAPMMPRPTAADAYPLDAVVRVAWAMAAAADHFAEASRLSMASLNVA